MPNLCDNRLTIWCDDLATREKISAAAAPPSISLLDKLASKFERTSETELCAEFATHYSPPVGALQHAAAQYGFRFRLLYCETGAGFYGVATEAENNEFEITLDRPPAD